MFSGGPRGNAGVREVFGAQSTEVGYCLVAWWWKMAARGICRFHDILSHAGGSAVSAYGGAGIADREDPEAQQPGIGR